MKVLKIIAVVLGIGLIVNVFARIITGPSRPQTPTTVATPSQPETAKPFSTPEAQRRARSLYAGVIEQKMVDVGYEMTTKATGKQHTVLHIKYALTGRVTSNAIGKGLDFAQLRELGFKQVVMTNGFSDELEETDTWAVK